MGNKEGENMIGAAPICLKCIHYNNDTTCKAFPDGIIDDILFNGNDHTQPIEGDNGIQFEPIKGDVEKVDWNLDFDIKKIDSDQQLVFGWLSIAIDKNGNVIEDADRDTIEESELEKAAYNHVLKFRKAGEIHQEIIGDLVESMVFTKEKQQALNIPDGILPVGWWVGYKINKSEAWDKVKTGEYSSFSIGGKGRREVVYE